MYVKENWHKIRRLRKVPVPLEWVRAGLVGLMEDHRRRQPNTPAVYLTRRNSYFADQNASCGSFKRAMRKLGLPESYKLKRAQKAHIHQLRAMKVPDERVATMTG